MQGKYQFTSEYQSLVVAAILQDPTLLVEHRDALRAEYFSAYNDQQVIRIVLEFYDQYRQRPLRDTLIQVVYDRANKLGWKDDARDSLVNDIYKIYLFPMQEADVARVKEKVSQFGRIQALKIAMLDSINLINSYESGDDTVKLDSVDDMITKALTVGTPKTMGTNVIQAMSNMKDLTEGDSTFSSAKRVGTGYPTIDKILNGGVGPGEIAFVIAPSNKGKSMILVNLAAACVRLAKKVIYFTFEMKEPEVAIRIAANLTGVDMSKVRSNDMEYQQRFHSLKSILDTRNCRVVYIKPSEATANAIRSTLMTIETVEGWKPDQIIVDYLDEMCPPSTGKREDDSYNAYGKLTSDLLSVAVDYECPLWTASQVNRQGYDGEPTLDNTGRSMQKIDKAEFVITPIQTEAHARDSKMIFKVLKNRRGPGVGRRIQCITDLAKAIIAEAPNQP